MTIENITELRAAKKKFAATYGPRIIREGYALAIGISRVQVNDGCASEKIGSYCIAGYLQPPARSVESFSHSLLERMRTEVLSRTYEGQPVVVRFLNVQALTDCSGRSCST